MSIGGSRDRRVSRRAFLGMGGLSAAALALGNRGALARPNGGRETGYGQLVSDPGGVLDLPRGFQYRIISQEGEPQLRGGKPVPSDFDAMGAFRGRGGTTVLIRNHENRGGEEFPVVGENPYDPTRIGGTTAIVVGRDRRAIEQYVTSSGSENNCAGGTTPWGTWLTCEETRTTNHGYVFEVDPREPENELSRTPIREMGFFSHEAAEVDPQTGIVYLTEDDFRGAIPDSPEFEQVGASRVSFLYRYIPNDRSRKPGALQRGGTLQAMAIEERPNYNADLAEPGDRFEVVWRGVNPEEPHDEAQAKGCCRFQRLEGMWYAGGAIWFDDTAGGEKRHGQIFRYIPATNTLELFYESESREDLDAPDNLTVSPWGDLWFAEDGDDGNRIVGITPEGEAYVFAYNRISDSEFAGPVFSPDGKTFFVNIQNPGITFAIWGPFARRDPGRQRRMATAAPPKEMAPRVSPELAEAAERRGMSELEAAAFDRLGAKLA
ncbi:MAG: alkaline phosphatase PhoX [Actinomycetota bacterium]